jgi:hypothetical protein
MEVTAGFAPFCDDNFQHIRLEYLGLVEPDAEAAVRLLSELKGASARSIITFDDALGIEKAGLIRELFGRIGRFLGLSNESPACIARRARGVREVARRVVAGFGPEIAAEVLHECRLRPAVVRVGEARRLIGRAAREYAFIYCGYGDPANGRHSE